MTYRKIKKNYKSHVKTSKRVRIQKNKPKYIHKTSEKYF